MGHKSRWGWSVFFVVVRPKRLSQLIRFGVWQNVNPSRSCLSTQKQCISSMENKKKPDRADGERVRRVRRIWQHLREIRCFFCGPPTLWARPDRFVRSRTYYTMSTRYVLRAIARIGARARADEIDSQRAFHGAVACNGVFFCGCGVGGDDDDRRSTISFGLNVCRSSGTHRK